LAISTVDPQNPSTLMNCTDQNTLGDTLMVLDTNICTLMTFVYV